MKKKKHERKSKLGKKLEVLKKKKKCMEVDVKGGITSADELDIKKMVFCMQSQFLGKLPKKKLR